MRTLIGRRSINNSSQVASQYYPATVTHDGFYRVIAAEHVGDTRRNDWYTELTCMAADVSSPVALSVQSNG
jgi:hypothetical protein